MGLKSLADTWLGLPAFGIKETLTSFQSSGMYPSVRHAVNIFVKIGAIVSITVCRSIG